MILLLVFLYDFKKTARVMEAGLTCTIIGFLGQQNIIYEMIACVPPLKEFKKDNYHRRFYDSYTVQEKKVEVTYKWRLLHLMRKLGTYQSYNFVAHLFLALLLQSNIIVISYLDSLMSR